MAKITHDRSEMNVLFIHSELDEQGLTAAEFRVFAHLSRREGKNEAYPGIDSMAKWCCLSKPTVITAIRQLEEMGMLHVTRKNGETNRYRLTAPSKWKQSRLKEGNGTTRQNEVTDQLKEGNGTRQNEGTEGYPREVNPQSTKKERSGFLFSIASDQLPPPLDHEDVRTEWDNWQLYCRQAGRPLTERTASMQIKRLQEMGPERAIAAIRNSIEKGWQGIYEPKADRNSARPTLKGITEDTAT